VFAAFVPLAFAADLLAQPEYEAVLVEAFQTDYPRRTSILNDISDTGLAVGWATDLTQTFSISAFSWSLEGDKVRLPDSQIDRAINSRGAAAGAMLVYTPWDGLTRTIPGVDTTHGRMRSTGLNDSLTAVGYAEISSGSNSDRLNQVPFWWDLATGTHPVPIPDARELLRLNNAGLAVGNIRHLSGGISEAFTYDVHTGEYVNLGAILPPIAASRPFSTTADVAESGLVAGNLLVFNGATNARTVFTWSAEAGFTVQDVLTGPECDFIAQGVNSAGVVVGYRRLPTNDVSPNTALIWDVAHGVRDLNSLVELPAGFVLRRAVKINENGWIAAQGIFTAQPSYTRGVVLRPLGAGCPADFNSDGQADFFDYLDFAQAFDASDPSADFNGDGQIDFFDYLDFAQAFDLGCA
jgi:hypothetical protein